MAKTSSFDPSNPPNVLNAGKRGAPKGKPATVVAQKSFGGKQGGAAGKKIKPQRG
jgi:hypothetical protein